MSCKNTSYFGVTGFDYNHTNWPGTWKGFFIFCGNCQKQTNQSKVPCSGAFVENDHLPQWGELLLSLSFRMLFHWTFKKTDFVPFWDGQLHCYFFLVQKYVVPANDVIGNFEI